MNKVLLSVLILPALFLAACGDGTQDEAQDAETGSGDEVLFTGKEIGYVTSFYDADDDGLRSMDVDLIEWYTGAEAARAAKAADPNCPGACTPPNGYYVGNAEKDPFTFEVANDVRVFLQTRNINERVHDEEVTYEQFLNTVSSNKRVNERYQYVPFWITHEDGIITEIREQFIP